MTQEEKKQVRFHRLEKAMGPDAVPNQHAEGYLMQKAGTADFPELMRALRAISRQKLRQNYDNYLLTLAIQSFYGQSGKADRDLEAGLCAVRCLTYRTMYGWRETAARMGFHIGSEQHPGDWLNSHITPDTWAGELLESCGAADLTAGARRILQADAQDPALQYGLQAAVNETRFPAGRQSYLNTLAGVCWLAGGQTPPYADRSRELCHDAVSLIIAGMECHRDTRETVRQQIQAKYAVWLDPERTPDSWDPSMYIRPPRDPDDWEEW